jgi:hypothetical protein
MANPFGIEVHERLIDGRDRHAIVEGLNGYTPFCCPH